MARHNTQVAKQLRPNLHLHVAAMAWSEGREGEGVMLKDGVNEVK